MAGGILKSAEENFKKGKNDGLNGLKLIIADGIKEGIQAGAKMAVVKSRVKNLLAGGLIGAVQHAGEVAEHK